MREAKQRTPRTWLFVPAHRPDRVAKALASPAEAVIVDLEDGVPTAQQCAARQTLIDAVAAAGAPRQPWYVRVHGVNEEACAADVRSAAAAGAAGVVLAKTQRADDVGRVVKMLRDAGRHMAIVPLIESPAGLLEARAIAAASEQVTALMLGAEDFALCLGPFVGRTSGGASRGYARWMLALAAAAQGVAAIDQVCLTVSDGQALERECEEACELGFSGKALIHPRQIAVVHRIFQPSREQVAWARRVLEAAKQAERAGDAAVLLEGRLVDRPVVERARETIALSQRLADDTSPASEGGS